MTEFFEDQIMPVFQSSVANKSYKIHPRDNQIVEAFEILNEKTFFDTLEYICCYNAKLVPLLILATKTRD